MLWQVHGGTRWCEASTAPLRLDRGTVIPPSHLSLCLHACATQTFHHALYPNKIELTLEKFIFSSRWVRVLFFLGLIVSMAVLLISVFSGYENFVPKLSIGAHEDRPAWMGKVGFSDLKMKLR